jgi:CheY-like chemotaxis protein
MFATFFILGGILSGLGLYYLLMASVLISPLMFLAGSLAWLLYSALEMIDAQNIRAPPRVLIVEDDFEMAVAEQMAFRQLGCEALIATDVDKARELLSENNTDIIILDWMLPNNVVAGDLIEELRGRQKNHAHVPKVVTCSSLSLEQINFPYSEHYDYFDHWQKPLTFSDLKNRSSELVAGF